MVMLSLYIEGEGNSFEKTSRRLNMIICNALHIIKQNMYTKICKVFGTRKYDVGAALMVKLGSKYCYQIIYG